MNEKNELNEIDLMDLFVPIWKHKKAFVGLCLTIVVLAVIYALVAQQQFKSSATIMTLEQQSSGGGLSSLLAASPLAGMVGGIGGGSSMNTITSLLKSRTMAENVFQKLRNDILTDWFPKNWDSANQKWKNTKQEPPKEQLLVSNLIKSVNVSPGVKDKTTADITAIFGNPELAKKVVDAYLAELTTLLNKKDLTISQRNKNFLEQQLIKNKETLLESSKEVNDFYKTYKVAGQNSNLSVDLEKDTKILSNDISPTGDHTVQDLPANLYLDYLNTKQQVLKSANSTLEAQYLMACIDAEKEKLGFYVIDPPETPIKRFKPQRRQIVMMAGVMSIFLGFILCHILEFWKKNGAAFKKRLSES